MPRHREDERRSHRQAAEMQRGALKVQQGLGRPVKLKVQPSFDRKSKVQPSLDRTLKVQPSFDRKLKVQSGLGRPVKVRLQQESRSWE